jgi:hypothetical protein
MLQHMELLVNLFTNDKHIKDHFIVPLPLCNTYCSLILYIISKVHMAFVTGKQQ